MSHEGKVKKSIAIISEAFDSYDHKSIAVAWSGHKDSTVVVHMVRKVFKDVPVLAFHNDTGDEFPEVLEFIDRVSKEWEITVLRIKSKSKIRAIEEGVSKYGIKAYISAIRRDEHISRKVERYFSERRTHMRVHPILDFSEEDIWRYIKDHNVPYVSLYDRGYRSLDMKGNTQEVLKRGSERSGRDKTKELVMARLRSLGYW